MEERSEQRELPYSGERFSRLYTRLTGGEIIPGTETEFGRTYLQKGIDSATGAQGAALDTLRGMGMSRDITAREISERYKSNEASALLPVGLDEQQAEVADALVWRISVRQDRIGKMRTALDGGTTTQQAFFMEMGEQRFDHADNLDTAIREGRVETDVEGSRRYVERLYIESSRVLDFASRIETDTPNKQ